MTMSHASTFTAPFPYLTSPLKIGPHTLRNRLFMASMHTRLEQLDRSVERRVAFYAERARGGAALLISAGYAPNSEGRLEEDAQTLHSHAQLADHRPVTAAVQAYGAKMLLQILHAGRYAKHDLLVAPSAIGSRINKRIPREMTAQDIERTMQDFVHTARLARDARYDGIEVMGSEGYLLNQFTVPLVNQRRDSWGGSLANRCRLPIELVRRIRHALGPDFIVAYRISALDLVEGGLCAEEIDYLAQGIEAAGADLLSTGIGWHESRVPTIAYPVPRGAWRFASARLKRCVSIPVVASNRINTPAMAEAILASGEADAVALARPLLADPHFLAKAAAGRDREINTCIACNQSCLDHIFSHRAATCLVNPLAAREVEFSSALPQATLQIAVIGAGPAGLACAVSAAQRGHRVVLFEAEQEIGGQLNLARRIPGKSEFDELLRYYAVQLQRWQVDVRLGKLVTVDHLAQSSFDRFIIASGAVPRTLELESVEPNLLASYVDVIRGSCAVGARVAIIGAGGIAHDVAELLSAPPGTACVSQTPAQFFDEWGVDPALRAHGGLTASTRCLPQRTVTMFQRSHTRPGQRLGVSTGWILRRRLESRGVQLVSGCDYVRIDRSGLHYEVGGQRFHAAVDTIIVCAGQEANVGLADALRNSGRTVDVIGGAQAAEELDAARAIAQGTRLAYAL